MFSPAGTLISASAAPYCGGGGSGGGLWLLSRLLSLLYKPYFVLFLVIAGSRGCFYRTWTWAGLSKTCSWWACGFLMSSPISIPLSTSSSITSWGHASGSRCGDCWEGTGRKQRPRKLKWPGQLKCLSHNRSCMLPKTTKPCAFISFRQTACINASTSLSISLSLTLSLSLSLSLRQQWCQSKTHCQLQWPVKHCQNICSSLQRWRQMYNYHSLLWEDSHPQKGLRLVPCARQVLPRMGGAWIWDFVQSHGHAERHLVS